MLSLVTIDQLPAPSLYRTYTVFVPSLTSVQDLLAAYGSSVTPFQYESFPVALLTRILLQPLPPVSAQSSVSITLASVALSAPALIVTAPVGTAVSIRTAALPESDQLPAAS